MYNITRNGKTFNAEPFEKFKDASGFRDAMAQFEATATWVIESASWQPQYVVTFGDETPDTSSSVHQDLETAAEYIVGESDGSSTMGGLRRIATNFDVWKVETTRTYTKALI